MSILLPAVIALRFFLLAYFFVGMPIQILLSISRGVAFNEANNRRFRIMGWVALTYVLIDLVAPFVLHALLRNWIPADFQPETNFAGSLVSHLFAFGSVAGLLLIGKAFRAGYALQSENALTV
ncbi:MAG: hypothetical protein JWP27_3028 [Flaviaesturariibacter sp.]|nr:hypothetical protein [Flaviaesturariibacter sp.]